MNRKTFKLGISIVLVVLLVGVGLFTLWAQNPYSASEIALQALESDDLVLVNEESGLITFEPVNAQSDIGFIFYPGGRVDYRAYAPVLHKIAAHGYFVALVSVPLNMAIFNTNAADSVMELFPNIQQWVVGGHSLGGVTASSYASENLVQIDGLVFWASYPADDSLKDTNIKALTIYGTNDMEGDKQINISKSRLPDSALFITIDGGNHAQFGSYGPQPGDRPATITDEEQWAQAAELTVQFLESLNE
ncbi:MAG TPA: alpha/beta hydrolase [Anaerolineales bacterium]|nr:alpha/beta hydrolase [Anaerolineales bacterium]